MSISLFKMFGKNTFEYSQSLYETRIEVTAAFWLVTSLHLQWLHGQAEPNSQFV